MARSDAHARPTAGLRGDDHAPAHELDREWDTERYALEALRGDIGPVPEGRSSDEVLVTAARR